MAVLFQLTDSGRTVSLDSIWEAIEAIVPRADLRVATDNIRQVVPAPNEDPDAE